MRVSFSFGPVGRVTFVRPRATLATPSTGGGWRTLPPAAQVYVAAVIMTGAAVLATFFPRSYPQPLLFALLAGFACLSSTWKVNLPMPVANGSTLSVSYAANLMSLLLLGPEQAVLIAVAGVVTQCRYRAKERYPLHRTIFSMAAAAITMAATGAVYARLEGPSTAPDSFHLARPLVGAIASYFVINTILIAGAIALSTGRSFLTTWRRDFLWSGASFMVAGSAGALAAVVFQRGEQWKTVLFVAPIYLTYRTYQLFAGRLEDQRRHTDEIRRLHHETVAALAQAREAERALIGEKQRLAVALVEMTQLEEHRNELLAREQAARCSAEEANRLKDQFLAMVSHELRTPLNAILGWADMLCQTRIDPALHDRALQGISHSARRQAQLIEDLLDVARIASGKLRLERALVDLTDVVRAALQVIQPAADAKRIGMALDADPFVGAINGDSARLQQVVSNLVSNAVKFTPEGGAVHVCVRRAGKAVEMTVSDTGQGIRPDFLPAVFEPFRQADGSTTRTHTGLGLGLAIVKSLVEAHGGSVSAYSGGEGQGTTFVVRLPVATRVDPVQAIAAVGATDGPRVALPSLEGLSVLVVDDDRQSRDVVAAHLHASKAAVLTAESAAEALDLLQQENVDVLLADIGMPHEDGYALIRRVRALEAVRKASVPAAALTAFARDEDRRDALQAGFQLHLAKPVDASSLVAAVASLGRMKPTGARRP